MSGRVAASTDGLLLSQDRHDQKSVQQIKSSNAIATAGATFCTETLAFLAYLAIWGIRSVILEAGSQLVVAQHLDCDMKALVSPHSNISDEEVQAMLYSQWGMAAITTLVFALSRHIPLWNAAHGKLNSDVELPSRADIRGLGCQKATAFWIVFALSSPYFFVTGVRGHVGAMHLLNKTSLDPEYKEGLAGSAAFFTLICSVIFNGKLIVKNVFRFVDNPSLKRVVSPLAWINMFVAGVMMRFFTEKFLSGYGWSSSSWPSIALQAETAFVTVLRIFFTSCATAEDKAKKLGNGNYVERTPWKDMGKHCSNSYIYATMMMLYTLAWFFLNAESIYDLAGDIFLRSHSNSTGSVASSVLCENAYHQVQAHPDHSYVLAGVAFALSIPATLYMMIFLEKKVYSCCELGVKNVASFFTSDDKLASSREQLPTHCCYRFFSRTGGRDSGDSVLIVKDNDEKGNPLNPSATPLLSHTGHGY